MYSSTYQGRPAPTLYKNQDDLTLALRTLVDIISQHDGSEDIPKDSDGYYPIKFLCEVLKAQHTHLYYINRNHVVEFYFKDLAREINFKGDSLIRYDAFKAVDDREILVRGLTTASLYNTPSDVSAALITSIHLLRDRALGLDFDEKGFCQITQLCDVLKERLSFLSYMNRNHIVELFFKDKQRKIVFNGSDLIKYKIKKIVDPPDTLYFGTIENLARKMVKRGIFSGTKGYIKLYKEPEEAIQFGRKFATQVKDRIIALEVDAKGAFDGGAKFSTYEEGEYIVSHIDKEHIRWSDSKQS